LTPANLVWDKVQLAAFILQETLIGLLYIRETASHLKNRTLLGVDRNSTRCNLRRLIAINVFIILLDCSVIGLCYGGFFFLQGFYKAAVYAVKLRTEFTILNQLLASMSGTLRYRSGNVGSRHVQTGVKRQSRPIPMAGQSCSRNVDEERMGVVNESDAIRVIKDVLMVSSNRDETVQKP
jgi:hypothetical protein